jgi:hypothetical protein
VIKAIETEYKGCLFRSRLEARWAVFFDELNIEWKYESEGFENDDGDRYLPDFYLPRSLTWVEVKGDKNALVKDHARMTRLLDWGGVLPGFKNSLDTASRGLLLLEDLPYWDGSHGIFVHPIIQHDEGIHKNWLMFASGAAVCLSGSRFARIGGRAVEVVHNLQSDPAAWAIETRFVKTQRASIPALRAYRAARSARFEFGQKGAML